MTGVDFARAIAGLGVDRGVAAFARYGLLRRSGDAHLATPLGRLPTRRVPVEGVDLLDELDNWLNGCRRAAEREKGPRYTAAVKDVEQAIYALATSGGHDEPRLLLGVLAAVGRCARVFAGLAAVQQRRARRKLEDGPVHSPLQALSVRWLERCADLPELRVAAALAGLGHGSPLGPLRQNLEPVQPPESAGRWRWSDPDNPSVVWSDAPLPINLARVLARRCLDAQRKEVTPLPLAGRWPVAMPDVDDFLRGAVDDDLIGDLTWALCGITDAAAGSLLRGEESAPTLPRVYALLKPLFWPGPVRDQIVRAEPSLLSLLAAGNARRAGAVATRRLRASGLVPLADDYLVSPRVARRLTAALLIPITPTAFDRCVRLVMADPVDAPGPSDL